MKPNPAWHIDEQFGTWTTQRQAWEQVSDEDEGLALRNLTDVASLYEETMGIPDAMEGHN